MSIGASQMAAAVVPLAPASGVRVSDDRRIERLVTEHHDLVWRNVRRLGVPDADVDDVVQEVFLAAARSIDKIEHERGFLVRTCIFVAGHARRKISRRREVSDDDQLVAIEDRSARPDETAEANQARAQLQVILDEMPTDLKSVFMLYELERFTMAEIAESLELPPGTVASRIRRARELFMTLAQRSNRTKSLR